MRQEVEADAANRVSILQLPSRAVVTSSFRTVIAPVLFAIFLANALPLVAAKYLDLGRPWLNADYLLVAALVVTRFRALGLVLLPIFFFVDVIRLVSQLFPISRLVDLGYMLQFVFLSSLRYQLLIAGVLVCAAVVTSAFWFLRPGEQRFKFALVLLNVGLLVYSLEVYTDNPGEELDRLWRVSYQPLAFSQTVSYYNQSNTGFWESLEVDGEAFRPLASEGGSDKWFETPPEELNERMLLIVSESWGLPHDPAIQQALTAPLTALRDRFEWSETGEFGFEGATIAGELRELCQLFPVHYNIASVEDGLESCLPNRLKEYGYETRAMHGAAGVMYDRIRWYPRVGFDELTFFESRNWPRRCYSFPGACDLDMMDEVEDVFAEPGKKFFYWLTLNSHHLYDERDIHHDVFDCEQYGVVAESQTCRNLKLHAQFFFKLAELLKRPSMADVEVLIVGDHEPPVFKHDEEVDYFVEDKVAWLRFKLK